jgi:hypothetical protein
MKFSGLLEQIKRINGKISINLARGCYITKYNGNMKLSQILELKTIEEIFLEAKCRKKMKL